MEQNNREFWETKPGRGRSVIFAQYNPANCGPFFLPVHWHDFLELLFVEAGEAVVFIDQQDHRVHAGDLIFVNPGEPHGFRSPAGVRFGYIQFHPDLISSHRSEELERIAAVLARGRCLPAIVPAAAGENARWRGMLREIITEVERAALYSDLRLVSLVFGLLAEVFERHLPPSALQSHGRESQAGFLYDFQDFVRSHFAEDLTLARAASALHLSRSHLCRLLRRFTGRTFHQYLCEYRLGQAQRLLRTTDNPVTRIALEAGFASLPAFDRAFRRLVGLSPSAYRNENRR